MAQTAKLYVQPWDVDSRLKKLGLTQTILREAVRAGEQERANCTSLNPRPFAGVAAWSWSVARFREQTIPQGWRIEDKNNLPLTIDPIRRIAVAITSGSAFTGDPDKVPSTKYPKGSMTAAQVKTNFEQLALFADVPKFVPTPRREEVITWLLLIFPVYDPRKEEFSARCELSLPAAIDSKGFVCEWAERIILEPVKLDEIVIGRSDDGDQDGDEQDLDIPVKRR